MPENSEYDGLNAQKQIFAGLLEQLRGLAVSLGNPPWCRRIETMLTRVRSDNFRVLVIGEFKRGKSTFINAMLGKKILPAFARPCTATIHELKYGSEPRAFIYRVSENGSHSSEPEEIDVGLVTGIKSSGVNGGQGLGTIQSDQVDAPCEYEKIEILWPLALLENGVEIIDSPGLNENGTREEKTIDFLPKADAIIFVMACGQLGNGTEMDFIKDVLIPMGHEDLFFVCNRFDDINEGDREKFIQYAHETLGSLVTSADRRIFFTSSLTALKGREGGNDSLVEASGIESFEKSLAGFLTRQKGQAKLMTLSMGMREIIRKLRRKVLEMEALANTSIKELEKRVESAKQPYEILKRKRQQINLRLADIQSGFQSKVYQAAKSFWNELTPELEMMATEIEVGPVTIRQAAGNMFKNSCKDLLRRALNAMGEENNSLAVPIAQEEDPIEKVIRETIVQLKKKITHRHSQWKKEELEAIISKNITMLNNELVDDLKNFGEAVQKLRAEISGVTIEPERVAYDWAKNLEELLPLIQRDISGMAIVEAMRILNPWLLIVSILQGNVLNFRDSIGINLVDSIKLKVALELKKHLDQVAQENSENLADSVGEELKEFELKVDEILEGELADISHQVKTYARLKQQGEEEVEMELSKFSSRRGQLDTIDKAIDGEVLKLLQTDDIKTGASSDFQPEAIDTRMDKDNLPETRNSAEAAF